MSLRKYAEHSGLEVLDAFVVPSSVGHRRLARARRRAHRHNFEYTPRPGYIYVRSRAISSRCNDNFDDFPAEEIKKAYRTFIGKPVFVNHHNADHRRARGVIIDAALHEDANPDGTEDTWAEVLMEVDAVRFPVLAQEVLKGNIARTSMGTDVEYSVCTACGNKAYTPADYCQHIPRMKGMKVHRTLASGAKEEVLVAEKCYGLGFFENSLLVEDPADPTAFVLGVDDSGLSRAAAKAVIEEGERITRSAPMDIPSDRVMLREGSRLPRASSAVEALVREAGQCVICNPRLSATGSEVMCDSHAFQASHGYNFPSHNFPRTALTYGPGAIYSGYSSIESAINVARQNLPIRNQVVKQEFWSDFIVMELPGKDGPVYQVYEDREQEPGGVMPPSERPPGKIVARVSPEGKVTRVAASRRTAARHVHAADEFGRVWDPERIPPGWGAHIGNGEWVTKCPEEGCGHLIPGTLPIDIQRHLYDEHGKIAPILGSRHHAYGETKAPAQVDTMRAEACPVCGDDEAFSGERCNVCGYVQPPSQFRDPDLNKAREMDLRQQQDDQTGIEQDPTADDGGDLQCTNCGEVFSAEGDSATGTDPSAQAEEEEPEPEHPRDTEDRDGPPPDEDDGLEELADTPDEELFEDEDEEGEKERDLPEDPASEDPAVGEGRITAEPEGDEDGDLDALEIKPNMTCPVCGQGTLVPTAPQPAKDGEPELVDVGTDPTKKKDLNLTSAKRRGVQKEASTDMNHQPNPAQQRRSKIVAAIREQQGVIEEQQRRLASQYGQIRALTDAVATLAVAAGVGNHPKFAGLVRSAGLRLASEEDPATSTEEAAKPKATDDVENVGAAPGNANDEVTPDGVTDVNNSDVVANPPVLDNLQDVTAPTSGTDAPTPDAGDAGSASRVTVGEPSNEAFDKPGDSGWKSSAKGGEQERFVASMRLARLRIAAGIEQGEDLALAQTIAASESPLGEINAQVQALAAVASRQGQSPSQSTSTRHLVPRAAARQGITPVRQQPSMQAVAATDDRSGEDEWMVGSVEA